MGFQRKTYSKHYECLSTDVKTVVDIEGGSTCTEIDTGKEFIFSGTTWGQNVTQTSVAGSLTDSLAAVVTVTATEVELTAGLAGRNQLIIYPPAAGYIKWGKTGNTLAPLNAGDRPVTLNFSVSFPIFAVNDGTNRSITVVESK